MELLKILKVVSLC